jgi:hypothetical protein
MYALLGGPAGNQRAVPGVLRDVERTVLLVVSMCVAVTAALAATYTIPRADPIHHTAEQTVRNAGPARLTPRLPP